MNVADADKVIDIWTTARARRYHRIWRIRQPFREWVRQTLLKRQSLGKLEKLAVKW